MEAIKTKEIDRVTARVIKSEGGYGLFIYVDREEKRAYPDLSADYARICAFSDAINRGEVSRLHIEELIEDFLE